MLRQHPLLFIIFVLFSATLACNAFAGSVEPALSVPPPLVTLEDGTAVSAETAIANIAATATLVGGGTAVANGTPSVTMLVDLNIRSGPGVVYDRLGFFLKGSTAQVLGQDPSSGWWLVVCPSEIAGAQCWVSGGAQYTLGSNTDAVPVAAVPPTPTPEPTATPATEPDAETAVIGNPKSFIVYSDTSGLWLLPLDGTQSPPAAGAAVQITAVANIGQIAISPDGQRVAFVAGDLESNRLGVASVSGSSQILVESTSLPNSAGDRFAVRISQMAWLPDSQTIAFNTQIINLEGPGIDPQADLWLATTNGGLTEQFAAETAGSTFALSPDGTRLIFGNPESVTRVNMDGSNREEIITFPFVNTASEYAWVPTAQWLPSGSQAYVAIADDDPWTEDAKATLYQIPVSGPAVEIGSLLGNTLFSPPQWTGNGSNLGYVQAVIDGSNVQIIVIADDNGDNPIPIASSSPLTFAGWNRAGTHFLYTGQGYLGVGQVGQVVEVSIAGGVGGLAWLNDGMFVTAVGSSGSWTLQTGDLAGNIRDVGETAVDFAQFDLWTP
jgi:WD40-like Beta Propeller Repeat